MNLSFQKLQLPEESDFLISWLTNEEWPFHSFSKVSSERVSELISKGFYSGPDNQAFWILKDDQEKVGMIRLFDLDDIGYGSPLFDLRILNRYRGQGIGKQAVKWLTDYLFNSWSNLSRIEGTTRVDNHSMRAIFRKSGYVKEGHYRKAWPTNDGQKVDTVQYAILREDWISGSPTLVKWND